MAVIQEIKEYALRAQRVGWQVDKSTGNEAWQYLIHCPPCNLRNCTHKVQLHSSPSDRNWYKTVERSLNRHGFDRAEADFAESNESLRRDAIDRAMQQNETKTKLIERLAEQHRAVNKAAGPYVAQPVDIHWLFGAHEVPESRRVLLPPDVSQVLTMSYNSRNRPIRPSRVQYWANQMRPDKNGNIRWRYTHQGISIDTTGELQDGQHRLLAAVQEKFTLDVQIFVGMPRENFGSIDVNAPRSAVDTMSLLNKSNPAETSGATRLIIIYDRFGSEMRSGMRTKIPNDELAEYVDKFGVELAESIDKAIEISRHQRHRGSPKMSKSALSAGIYLISRRLPENDERLVEFLRGYDEGTNLPNGDVRVPLRTFMTNLSGGRENRNYVPAHEQLAVFIKAWNAWVTGRSMSYLAYRKDELMPSVFLPPPKENN